MSGGETLLLLPSPWSLVQLPRKASMGSTRRCLFGLPDATSHDVSEERERVIRRWDFDVVEEKPVCPPRRYLWVECRKRCRVTPYKQLRITDFWRTRKFDGSNKRNSPTEQSSSKCSSTE